MISWMMLAACANDGQFVERIEPTFLYVELLEDEVGSLEEPLAFTSEPTDLQVRVTTLDIHGDPTPFAGDLTLDFRPGDVYQDGKVGITDGVYEGPVTVKNGFGPTRIWFSDLGDKDTDSGRQASFATGVSDPLWYHLPTVSEMNQIDDHETNQLEGEFTEIRAEDREVRVSYVGAEGFYIADVATEIGSHRSMFVYTFSKPDDEILFGSRLNLLNGNNQEYLGSTQLSFPSYEVSEDTPLTEEEIWPDGIPTLSFDICGENDILEGYEGAFVRLENVRIPSDFVPMDDPEEGSDYADYLEYGQWPLSDTSGTTNCLFYADSGATIPTFYPTDHAGENLEYIQGMLYEIWGTWVLAVREDGDIPEAYRPADTTEDDTRRRARRPVPRPKPTAL